MKKSIMAIVLVAVFALGSVVGLLVGINAVTRLAKETDEFIPKILVLLTQDLECDDPDLALTIYEACAREHPDWFRPYLEMRRVLDDRGEIDKARNHYEKALPLVPDGEEWARDFIICRLEELSKNQHL